MGSGRAGKTAHVNEVHGDGMATARARAKDPLEHLGLSAHAAALYRRLCEQPSVRFGELPSIVGLAPADVQKVVAELVGARLAEYDTATGVVRADPPLLAFPRLIARRTAQFGEAVMEAAELTRRSPLWAEATERESQLVPAERVAGVAAEMCAEEGDVLVVDTPTEQIGDLPRPPTRQLRLLTGAVPASVNTPWLRHHTGRNGCYLVVGRRRALLPVNGRWGEPAWLIEMPWLAEALAATFDRDWREADDVESASQSALVALLASGLTDDALARRLGCSQRTIRRRIDALMRSMGTGSRFAAGVEAARRGLV